MMVVVVVLGGWDEYAKIFRETRVIRFVVAGDD